MKTLTAADQESLQASWWDRQSSLSLRGRDILSLIDYGLRSDPNAPTRTRTTMTTWRGQRSGSGPVSMLWIGQKYSYGSVTRMFCCCETFDPD